MKRVELFNVCFYLHNNKYEVTITKYLAVVGSTNYIIGYLSIPFEQIGVPIISNTHIECFVFREGIKNVVEEVIAKKKTELERELSLLSSIIIPKIPVDFVDLNPKNIKI